MIIIKLEGGLGNQMFQYALGRNLSLIHNTTFKIDYSYLKKANQSQRTLIIDNYNTVLEEVTDKEVASYTSIFQKILDKIRSKKKMVVEKSNLFDSNILLRNDGYFVGHWNNEKYFKINENIIRNDFKLKKPFGEMAQTTAEKINSTPNATGIHIRRGDYVTIKKIADKHGVLSISYYEQTMAKIIERFPDTVFFVFSDDMEWAKENFPKKYPVIFVSNPNIPDYEELILMSLCKHNIIANSTFSWWGAWLNTNPNKIVIAPKNWFTDINKDTNDLILPAWIQI
ncbi:MAG: alpha-1,2-fucosyltransferase [Candidatus Zambryskibacteria bacterium]|nr:alpha-1,2-fucosyltransferase [Candidatus Zambryskibacteria bacterium]